MMTQQTEVQIEASLKLTLGRVRPSSGMAAALGSVWPDEDIPVFTVRQFKDGLRRERKKWEKALEDERKRSNEDGEEQQ